MKVLMALIVSGISLILSSCASLNSSVPSVDELLMAHTKQDGRECIRESDIRGYGALDGNLLSVNSRKKNAYYLVSTIYRCSSIESTSRAAFVGSYSEFCGGGRDKVFTGEEACPIKHIFKFNSRDEAFEVYELVKQKRKELKEIQKNKKKEKNKQ